MEGSPKVDFFISRAGADQALAQRIGEILEAAGYSVILQDWDFGGADFVAKMDDALARSRRVITLLSDAYQNSEFCGAEWRAVFVLSKGDTRNFDQRLIVFRVSQCEPRGILCTLAYTDLVRVLGSPAVFRDVVLARVDANRPRDASDAASPYRKTARAVLHHKVREVPNFTDRKEALAAIGQALKRGRSTAVMKTATVCGLGGVGKSALVSEFGWRNRRRYSGVWWIDAGTETEIESGLIALGAQFIKGLDKANDRPAAARIAFSQVLPAFEKPWLLIYDNVEDDRLLPKWLPSANAAALVTSRFEAFHQQFAKIPIETLNREDSKRYLRAESNRTEVDTDFDLLADNLGDLPLALSHAAAYLRYNQAVPIAHYRKRIATHLAQTPGTFDDQRSVFATYQTAIERLDPGAPGAGVIMCFTAFLAPDDIPEEFFKQDASVYPEAIRSLIQREDAFEEALSALHRYSLVRFDNARRTFSVHRLVQAAIRATLADEQVWIAHVFALLRGFLKKKEEEEEAKVAQPKGAADARSALPHLVHISRNAGIPDGKQIAEAFRAGAEVALRAGLSDVGLLLAEAADRAAGGRLDESDSVSMDARLTLLTALKSAGTEEHLRNAYKLGLDAVEKLRASHDETSERTLNFKVHLADTMDRLGDLDVAKTLLSDVLEIRKRLNGEASPEYVTAQGNLANVLSKEGKVAEAMRMQQAIVSIRTETIGVSAPETLTAMTNLAVSLYDLKEFVEAERLQELVVEHRMQALGEENPDTLTAMSNLALTLRELSKLSAAISLQRKVLERFRKNLGEAHLDTIIAMRNLAASLYQSNKIEEARCLHKQILDHYVTILEPKHITVSEAAYRVWEESCRLGDDVEAGEVYLQYLSWMWEQSALSTDHQQLRHKIDRVRKQGM